MPTEIRGKQIKDDSVTGDDIDESTLILDTLRDIDGDTKIQIEESADEDKIRFDTAGIERMQIDNNGKVGIGTTSPGYNLHVAGAAAAVVLIDGAAGADAFLRFGQAGTLKSYIKQGSGGNLVITNETADKDIIFNIKDNTTSREGLRLNGDVAEVVINEGSNSLVDFRVESDSNTHMLFVDGSSNNVGVNHPSPQTALDVRHNPSSLADNTGGGESVTFGTGSLTAGKIYYFNSSGAWTETDADAIASSAGLLALALGSTPSDGMLLRGFFDATTYLSNFVPGLPVYLSATAASMDTIQPAGTGDVVRCVGYCTNTANVIYFNPSSTTIELA
jgi:hypothetical protein